jgi:copper chaperone CopZ
MNETNLQNFRPVLTKTIGIEGMTCEQCVKTIERVLRSKKGVTNLQVNLQQKTAEVTYDTRETDLPALHEALLQAGYKPTRTLEDNK